MADYETILAARDGDVLILTLNRPQSLNAAPPQMFDEIRAAIADPAGARAVLIAGAGRGFCSGAVVSATLLSAPDPGQITYQALAGSYHPTIQALAELDIPVVTAVRGPAAGIGCSLGLAGDFVICSTTAYFLQAFVNVGLVPDGGASWSLPRQIGRARAAEMMMLGERIPAQKALDWGLVYKVVPDKDLDGEALALARQLAEGPTQALGAIRRNLYAALHGGYADALQREAETQKDMRATADSAEGGLAFIEKRKPVFRGE